MPAIYERKNDGKEKEGKSLGVVLGIQILPCASECVSAGKDHSSRSERIQGKERGKKSGKTPPLALFTRTEEKDKLGMFAKTR
jgi:hypothetical protein